MIPESLFRTSPVITRYPEPVLTSKDVPYDSNLTFNAGIVKENGRYIMLFRNDYGCTREQFEKEGRNFAGTNIGLAFSDDGIHWQVESQPVLELRDEEISRAYDPRITCMDGQYYVCFAVDTRHGVRGGIFSTHDFHHFAPISLSVPDNRNMVLFPEKIGGKYVRLERPMPVYSTGGHFFDIWLSDSPDLASVSYTHLTLPTIRLV